MFYQCANIISLMRKRIEGEEGVSETGDMEQLEQLERFSNECRKTKTKVITPANHNKHKLPNEPIRTRSKYM